MLFRNDRLQKAWLLKCLKSPVSELLCTINMLEGPKHCWNLQGSICVIFFDHSERTSFWTSFILVISGILRLFVNILTLDGKYFLSVKVSFQSTKFSAIMSVIANLFSFFVCIYEIYMKSWRFGKGGESHSWCFSEMIDWKKRGYLNA